MAIYVIFWYHAPMNISLPAELEEVVDRRVRTGRYGSASEVVREALRLLEERDRLRDLRFLELKRDVEAGVAELDRGEASPLDVARIKAAGRKLLGKRTRK
jgi:antitoxin ParD1/3/4